MKARVSVVLGVALWVGAAACSSTPAPKPLPADLLPPEYEPARKLDLTPAPKATGVPGVAPPASSAPAGGAAVPKG